MRPNIDISNYESFALDYLEGNLIGEELDAFVAFLSIHPEIEAEMEGELPQLTLNEPVSFASKLSLFKNPIELPLEINKENCVEFFIAFHENDLSENQKQLVFNFLSQHPDKTDDFEMVRKSRLANSIQFEYEEKHDLKIDDEFQMSNYDKKLIGFLENDLSDEERNKVIILAEKSNKTKHDIDLYGKSKLIADESIVYPNKSSLKQYQTSNLPWFGRIHRVANFAASIAAAVLVGFFNPFVVEYQLNNQLSNPSSQNSTTFPIVTQPAEYQINTSVINQMSAQLKHQDYQNKNQFVSSLETIKSKTISTINIPKADIAQYPENTIVYVAQPQQTAVSSNPPTANFEKEKVESSHPLYTYAAEKVKNIFKKEADQSSLDINWRNAAMSGLNSLGRFTESNLILSYAPNNFDQNQIFSLKKKETE